MTRPIFYANSSIAVESLLLLGQQDMISSGAVLQALTGSTSPMASGLAVAPTSPASLGVTVGPGLMTSYQPADPTGYGTSSMTLNDPVTKVGINTAATPLSFTPPSTAGQSAAFLIEATFAETDTQNVVLSYKDPTTGTVVQGPNGSNTSQPTQRAATVSIRVKAGTPANTGSQVVPAPDNGWMGLAVVTLAHGQTTIQTGDIAAYSGRVDVMSFFAHASDLSNYLSLTAAAANYVQESETSISGDASKVVRRDTSGAITASALHGNADTATLAATATRATSAATADTTAHATLADTATSSTTATNVQGFIPSNNAGDVSTLVVRDGLANINCHVLHGKADFASNSDTLGSGNYAPDVNATSSTVVVRDGSGNINCAHLNGEASSADFGDLSERFHASEPLEPGDLVELGGSNEIQKARGSDVFAVVATAPAFRMNAAAGNDQDWPYVCWSGRVPVKVAGPARKGDFLVKSDIDGVALAVSKRPVGVIIGRALEAASGDGVNLVMAAVRASL